MSNNRHVNPVVEIAGRHWLVYEWRALSQARTLPETISLCRLEPREVQTIIESSVDWEVWEEAFKSMRRRREMPKSAFVMPQDKP